MYNKNITESEHFHSFLNPLHFMVEQFTCELFKLQKFTVLRKAKLWINRVPFPGSYKVLNHIKYSYK